MKPHRRKTAATSQAMERREDAENVSGDARTPFTDNDNEDENNDAGRRRTSNRYINHATDELSPPPSSSSCTSSLASKVIVCFIMLWVVYTFVSRSFIFLVLVAVVVGGSVIYTLRNNIFPTYQLVGGGISDDDDLHSNNTNYPAEVEFHLQMERINREREESEQMVEEAARMMLEINRRHLEDFLTGHPAATYEEWIADLHPENVNNSGGDGAVDHRFYVETSDHRLLWNELRTLGDYEREFVPASSGKDSTSNGEEKEDP
jgi:hypothetical protein